MANRRIVGTFLGNPGQATVVLAGLFASVSAGTSCRREKSQAELASAIAQVLCSQDQIAASRDARLKSLLSQKDAEDELAALVTTPGRVTPPPCPGDTLSGNAFAELSRVAPRRAASLARRLLAQPASMGAREMIALRILVGVSPDNARNAFLQLAGKRPPGWEGMLRSVRGVFPAPDPRVPMVIATLESAGLPASTGGLPEALGYLRSLMPSAPGDAGR